LPAGDSFQIRCFEKKGARQLLFVVPGQLFYEQTNRGRAFYGFNAKSEIFLHIISRLFQIASAVFSRFDSLYMGPDSLGLPATTVGIHVPNKNFSFEACSTDNILGSQTILERITNGYGRN
jgi:hypothetical protein